MPSGSGRILRGMVPAYPGEFLELNPQRYPLQALLGPKGIVEVKDQLYGFTYHNNPDQDSSTLNLKPDYASVTYGSTGFTSGSNVVNIWYEGAFETWARKGVQQLGGTTHWQGANNPSVEPDALSRGIMEALDRIKGQAEHVFREGVFNYPSTGTTGTFQQTGFRYAPGITNKLATGAVAGAGTLGTLGTLTFDLFQDTLQTLWDNSLAPDAGWLVMAPSEPKKLLTEIIKSEYNMGKNSESINVAGVNLERVVTDFGVANILLTPQPFPTRSMYILNLDVMHLVGRPVPGKGMFFEDDIRNHGYAGEGVGIYTEYGLHWGHGSAHARFDGIGSTAGVGGFTVSST